jgi:CheY-like chemotaxis protein
MQSNDLSNSRRVLVVDDEEDIREIIRWALTREGYEVALFDNGREAVEAAKEGRYQLALIDVAMPGMDGLTTLRALKEASPATQVVMITAFLDTTMPREDRRNRLSECLAEGARGCLRKPFTASSIVQTADYFVQESHSKNEGAPRSASV